jgi:predicted dehydrogenase
MKILRLGIIGGGLMGREAASALARWCNLVDVGVKAELTAVCDCNPAALEWFQNLPSVRKTTTDIDELLACDFVNAIYVAVPHHLHEEIYLKVVRAGKALLAEKPFGVDRAAAERILAGIREHGCFARISSEFPFWPGPQRIVEAIKSGGCGRLLQVRCGFLHASDLNPEKPINWKRQVEFCGAAGVMNDLGMHAAHIPMRLGWAPTQVYGRLQNVVDERPDGKGGMAPCDTWENALIDGVFTDAEGTSVPISIEMKRVAPGETDTWYLEVYGVDSCYRFSTKEPKTLWRFFCDGEQWWQKTDLGNTPPFKVVTPGITEFGFSDCFQQMLAAFAAEWAGTLGERFGCVTPEEAVNSHLLWEAAMRSQEEAALVKANYLS